MDPFLLVWKNNVQTKWISIASFPSLIRNRYNKFTWPTLYNYNRNATLSVYLLHPACVEFHKTTNATKNEWKKKQTRTTKCPQICFYKDLCTAAINNFILQCMLLWRCSHAGTSTSTLPLLIYINAKYMPKKHWQRSTRFCSEHKAPSHADPAVSARHTLVTAQQLEWYKKSTELEWVRNRVISYDKHLQLCTGGGVGSPQPPATISSLVL